MAVLTHFDFNERELHALLVAPTGAVGRDLERRALRVESAAKVLAPIDGGRLRASIHRGPITPTATGGMFIDIGSDLEYAIHVEQGTSAHIIRPRRKKALWWGDTMTTPRVVSPKRGIYSGTPLPVPFVRHPGTKARPFLGPALAAAVT